MAKNQEPKLKIKLKSSKQPEKLAAAFTFLAKIILAKVKGRNTKEKNL